MDEWKARFPSSQYDGLKNGLYLSTRDLNRYLDLVENAFIEIAEKRHDPLTDDEAIGLSVQERKIFDDFYGDEIIGKYTFANEFYKSFVISLFSKIEKELIEFCKQELELKLIVSASDTEHLGRGIYRAQKFLHKAAGFVINAQLWRELQVVSKVRNFLVHSDSPYMGTIQKPQNKNVVKIHVELNKIHKDYYLQIDNDLYKHVSKAEILSCSSMFYTPTFEYAVFKLTPTYEYCRQLIYFRKRLLLHIYDGCLEIAKAG